ncbi:hypothetical protein I6F35_28325 [Bradyrhizobium sp. BRP22]|uniref:hypothetical protein n=1 Tax=Bradyrhizobium sp. BRP22 TaxID=2793821 RepID=UPI001CD7ECEF|nr:hypothetical protein [Bradyrhizobium sp. BRP22]MCA1457078.1 hypothetical protein [Bradyrhizobium sp. BRP22]
MLTSTEDLAAFAAEQREVIISKVPFRVRRAVRWSECDPAGVVYTGQFSEYLLSSIYLFSTSYPRRNLAGDQNLDEGGYAGKSHFDDIQRVALAG